MLMYILLILGLSNIILLNVLVIWFFLWYQIPSLDRYTTITLCSDQSSENNWVLNADQRVDRQPENPVLLHRKWKDEISEVNALYHFTNRLSTLSWIITSINMCTPCPRLFCFDITWLRLVSWHSRGHQVNIPYHHAMKILSKFHNRNLLHP